MLPLTSLNEHSVPELSSALIAIVDDGLELGCSPVEKTGALEVSIPKMGTRARRIRWSEQAFCNLRTLPGVPALIIQRRRKSICRSASTSFLWPAATTASSARSPFPCITLRVCGWRRHWIPEPDRHSQLLYPHVVQGFAATTSCAPKKSSSRIVIRGWRKSRKSGTFRSLLWVRSPAKFLLFMA